MRNIWRSWNHYGLYILFAVAVVSLIAFLPRPKTTGKDINHISQSFAGKVVITPREAAANSTLGVSRRMFVADKRQDWSY